MTSVAPESETVTLAENCTEIESQPRMPAERDGSTGYTAGVRKPPRNETAGRLGSMRQVSRPMGKALQRWCGLAGVRC